MHPIAKLLFRTASQNRNRTSLLCNFKEQVNLYFKVGTHILTSFIVIWLYLQWNNFRDLQVMLKVPALSYKIIIT